MREPFYIQGKTGLGIAHKIEWKKNMGGYYMNVNNFGLDVWNSRQFEETFPFQNQPRWFRGSG